jgi:hypothetical protein
MIERERHRIDAGEILVVEAMLLARQTATLACSSELTPMAIRLHCINAPMIHAAPNRKAKSAGRLTCVVMTAAVRRVRPHALRRGAW